MYSHPVIDTFRFGKDKNPVLLGILNIKLLSFVVLTSFTIQFNRF